MRGRKDAGEIRAPAREAARSVEPLGQLELAEMLQAAARQLQLAGVAPRLTGPTFGEMADHFLVQERRRLAAPDVVERHLKHLEWIRDMREGEISPRLAREALYSLLEPRGPLSAVTVNKVRSTASRVIREAQMAGDWKGIDPFAVVRRLKERKADWDVLTISEARALLPHLRDDRRREALVMMVLGPRPGELKALHREDLDTSRWLVTWRRSNARDTTKTGRVRTVPVPDQLIPAFKEALRASRSELVFPKEDGSQQRHDTKMCRVLRTALGAAGIVSGYAVACRRSGCGFRDEVRVEPEPGVRCPSCRMRLWVTPQGRRIRWYDLRHSAATLHREAGCDPLVIQLSLGHASRSVTDSVYTHLSESFMRENLNRLARLWY